MRILINTRRCDFPNSSSHARLSSHSKASSYDVIAFTLQQKMSAPVAQFKPSLLPCWRTKNIAGFWTQLIKMTDRHHTPLPFISPIPAPECHGVNIFAQCPTAVSKRNIFESVCLLFYSFNTQSPMVPSFFGTTILYRRPGQFTLPLMVVSNNFCLSIHPSSCLQERF